MTKTAPLKPAEQFVRDFHDRPQAHHRPDEYVADMLGKLPPAQSVSSAELVAVAALDLELAAAAAGVAALESAKADPRTRQHADARATLAAYLEPLHTDTEDIAAIEHLDECQNPGALEAADHLAESAYGRCRVRIARCLSCGAQVVANRRIVVTADPKEQERQRARGKRPRQRQPSRDQADLLEVHVIPNPKEQPRMSKSKPDPATPPVPEHTEGGSTTRDAVDVGVPMAVPVEAQTVGPEDAAGLEPTRGNYSGRTSRGTTIEAIPEAEQVPGGPKVRVVEQGAPPPPAAA